LKNEKRKTDFFFTQPSTIYLTVLLSGSLHISPVFSFHSFFLLIKLHIDENEYGALVGKILTGDNRSNRRKTGHGSKFSTGSLTRLAPDPILSGLAGRKLNNTAVWKLETNTLNVLFCPMLPWNPQEHCVVRTFSGFVRLSFWWHKYLHKDDFSTLEQ